MAFDIVMFTSVLVVISAVWGSEFQWLAFWREKNCFYFLGRICALK